MTSFNFSDFSILIFLGLAGGVAGYILRRLEKFEETSDNIRALTLTQISAAANLFLQSVDHFIKRSMEKQDLLTLFDSIDNTLKKQIFEQGGVALLKENKRKRIVDFYFAFLMLSKDSKNFSKNSLITKFKQEKQTIGGISMPKITEMVNLVQLDLDDELKHYKIKLPLIMITLTGILAVVSAIIAYIKDIVSAA